MYHPHYKSSRAFFFYFVVRVLIGECGCMGEGVLVYVYVYVCGGQRSTLGVILHVPAILSLKTR